MIEKMKKVSIVSLLDDHKETLKTLRDLEIIHIDYAREESSEFNDSMREAEALDTAIRALKEFASKEEIPAGNFANMDYKELAQATVDLVHELNQTRETILELHREVNEWMPWGDFKAETVEELRAKGLNLLLCRCPTGANPELPDGAFMIEIAQSEGDTCFIVASNGKLDPDILPTIKLPDYSLSQLTTKIREKDEEIDKLKKRLARAATQSDRLDKALLKRGEAADFVRAGDAMGQAGRLEYITGYIPANRRSELIQMAYRRGWALLLDDPADDDPNIPTLLRVPKWLQISKPIFNFVGISPGYKEFDVSALFLIFFTIFFSMIIGDGGYGALFLVVSVAGRVAAKTKDSRLVANLFIVLSCATIGWGFLTGNWFGMANGWNDDGVWLAEATRLPRVFCGVPWFLSEANIQYLCFMIAVVHLCLAHGWKTLVLFAHKKVLPALGEIGWFSFICGVFLIIVQMVAKIEVFGTEEMTQKVAMFMIVPGFIIMLLFSVNWKDVGDILNFPFGALGGFVDSLSYIRLYAVGLSGYFVAVAVNDMSSEMMNAGMVGVIGGVAIAIFGHLLNITLCAMGVLVHGIRLNTLEFSGHLGLEWAGTAFKPFRRKLK